MRNRLEKILTPDQLEQFRQRLRRATASSFRRTRRLVVHSPPLPRGEREGERRPSVVGNSTMLRFLSVRRSRVLVVPGFDEFAKSGGGLIRIGAAHFKFQPDSALGGQAQQIQNAPAIGRIAVA